MHNGELCLARSLKLRKASLLGGMAGVAPASETQSFGASEGRLYSAALKASLLIASPLLYLIFVAIIAIRDRVRMNAIMQQRVAALNLAPFGCRKFRFHRAQGSRPMASVPTSKSATFTPKKPRTMKHRTIYMVP